MFLPGLILSAGDEPAACVQFAEGLVVSYQAGDPCCATAAATAKQGGILNAEPVLRGCTAGSCCSATRCKLQPEHTAPQVLSQAPSADPAAGPALVAVVGCYLPVSTCPPSGAMKSLIFQGAVRNQSSSIRMNASLRPGVQEGNVITQHVSMASMSLVWLSVFVPSISTVRQSHSVDVMLSCSAAVQSRMSAT